MLRFHIHSFHILFTVAYKYEILDLIGEPMENISLVMKRITAYDPIDLLSSTTEPLNIFYCKAACPYGTVLYAAADESKHLTVRCDICAKGPVGVSESRKENN